MKMIQHAEIKIMKLNIFIISNAVNAAERIIKEKKSLSLLHENINEMKSLKT